MTITARTVLKDRFWVIEEESKKIGTLCWDNERYLFNNRSTTMFFNDVDQLRSRVGLNINWSSDNRERLGTDSESDYSVYGYPTSVQPFNILYDVKNSLPLFTKSNTSKSLYCAGYYLVKFNKGWVKGFCPKLITIERNESRGPFRTEDEMKKELNNVNRNTN